MTLSSFISSIITFLLSIPTIIFSTITFLLGMWVQAYRIKNSNIREKAKKLDAEIMKNLKIRSDEIKKRIDDADYISINDGDKEARLKFNGNEYDDLLNNSGIFRVKGNKIALTYNEDSILKKHAKIIIQNLEKYQSEVSSLKEEIKNLNIPTMPIEFKNKIIDLVKKERGMEIDILDKERLDEFLFIAYMISISGSQNSYRSGRTWLIDLIKKRFNDLQNIVKSDSKSMDTSIIIETKLNNILSCLKAINDEIDNLHDDWQNKLII